MKNVEVIKKFLLRERSINSTGSLTSTGNCLYSYSTCIAEFDINRRLHINLTKYSVSTSRHQKLLLDNLNIYVHKVHTDIDRNKVHIVLPEERIY